MGSCLGNEAENGCLLGNLKGLGTLFAKIGIKKCRVSGDFLDGQGFVIKGFFHSNKGFSPKQRDG